MRDRARALYCRNYCALAWTKRPYNYASYVRSRPYSSGVGPPFKILLMGRDEFSCIVLRELHSARDVWQSIDIATNPDEQVMRRGAQLSVSPLKLLGQSLKHPVHLIPHTKAEFRHWKPPPPFATSEPPPPNHVVVTASFGRILPSSLLDRFLPGKRLNVHPSLLPAYRGSAPIQHTLMNGERETGVCVIDMLKFKEGIDTGAIWDCSRVPLYDMAMFPEVRNTLAHVGGRLLVSVLRDIRTGKAKSIPQHPVGDLTHAHAITVDDSLINFNTMSAKTVVNRYRGISHQRAITTHLPSGKALQLHSPEVFSHSPSKLSEGPGAATFEKATQTLVVRCVDGSVLSVPLVKQDGKGLVSAKDWWNGAKGLGFVIENELCFRN